MQGYRVRISGRVQGVGYRFATQQQALKLGLCGWVRNLAEGCVEAWFVGEAAALEAMLNWCEQGPPAAEVTAVEVVTVTADAPGAESFEIRS